MRLCNFPSNTGNTVLTDSSVSSSILSERADTNSDLSTVSVGALVKDFVNGGC